jgi:hypothetical protein
MTFSFPVLVYWHVRGRVSKDTRKLAKVACAASTRLARAEHATFVDTLRKARRLSLALALREALN